MKARSKSTRNLNGYRVIYLPNNIHAMKSNNWQGYVYEHVVIAEKALGRRMSRDEVVHHLDGNRSNNRRGNLLVLTRKQHAKLHRWIESGAPGLKSPGKHAVNSKKSKTREPYCLSCGKTLQEKQKKYCSRSCATPNRYIVKHPSKLTLRRELLIYSRESIGRKYGVSGNAVKKWAIKLNLL